MCTKLIRRVAKGLRAFHDDEAGEGVVGSVAIGAVGVLLATVIFSVMRSTIQDTGGSGLSGVMSGALGGLGSLLPF